MIIFPAIDILDGSAVRLRQGSLGDVTLYNNDPVEQAHQWVAGGAEWIHVVDLDGAVLGRPCNIDVIQRIVRAVDVHVQVGGGIRNMETLDALCDAGAERCVLGTALVSDPDFVSEACAKYEGIVAGIDARDGKVAIEGWRQGTEYEVLELVSELEKLGVKRLIYTDIARDGMQGGVNHHAYRALADQVNVPIVASGGVTTLDDIRDLASIGPRVEGVIVGTALYEKRFTLPDAIAAARAEEAE